MEILTRGWVALCLVFGGLGVARLYRRWASRRTPSLFADLGPLYPGAFTLVYFTAPTCVPCQTIQRPAIERLKELLGRALQVVEIDVTARPELASRWGVLSVPTTFVIDPRGKVRHINHGVTRAEKLLLQIHR